MDESLNLVHNDLTSHREKQSLQDDIDSDCI